ncbi:MAG: aminotransferase class I/II-fold pyridoxal phosphate-dependent enzyme [Bacteroidetes bacterium]|nr:aminotransferase class I/II-fold pyridoxal phosphate-dependent enzyme [Bacteroidota bacterium]
MIHIADRISRLGTETAFAVSAEAAAWAAKGNKIYPFHLGDINIPTPATVIYGSFKAIKEGKTGYCPTAGIQKLREMIAADLNGSHGTSYTFENVAIQPGGKPVIGKFLLALMNPGDEVLYPNPGYPIYESQIEFNGGVPVPYGYIEGKKNFAIDVDSIKKSISKRTRLFILNDLHNPTGAECSQEELNEIARLAINHDLIVLSDEAYFDIRYKGKSCSIASLPGMEKRTVILYAFSKKFAMAGWRLGAAVGPKKIVDVIAKLNVNFESCTNHFIQYGAVEGLTGNQEGVKNILNILKERRDAAHEIIQSIEGIRCYRPNATFYLYPDVTEAMRAKGFKDYDTLRKEVLHNTGVSFCTRQHFGKIMPGEKKFYIRIAYSGINLNDLKEGLTKFKEFMII